jgi:hypothetical protein
MSKGLGKLQLQIMDRCRSFWAEFEIDDDKLPGCRYEDWRGGEYRRRPAEDVSCPKLRAIAETCGLTLEPIPAMRRCVAVSRAISFNLDPPVIDLRLVKKRMQTEARTDHGEYSLTYSAGFSRAVRGLVERKLLLRRGYGDHREIRFVELVPLAADPPNV